jgi:hypothetical protein
MIESLNEFAWSLATDENVLNADLAQCVATDMQSRRGRRLLPQDKDTIAVCFARAGDFASGMRWQQAAIAEGAHDKRHLADMTRHLDLFRAKTAKFEHHSHLVDVSDKYPDGTVRLEGFTEDGKRCGHWRVHHQGGAIAIDGWMHDDLPFGRWQTFHHDGHMTSDGWALRGRRLGCWKTFYAYGTVASEGSY